MEITQLGLKSRFANGTRCVREVLDIFSFAYGHGGEIMINSLFNNVGVFDLLNTNNNNFTSNSYTLQKKRFITWSHIWSNFNEVSSLLMNSFTYHNICLASIKYIDDNELNNNVINLRNDLIRYFHHNADFLAYCDMEYCGMFLYTNGKQALDKTEFVHYYRKSYSELDKLESKYVNQTPRIVMTIFDDIREILTIRELYGESLIYAPDPLYLPRVPYLSPDVFEDILDKYNSLDLIETRENLEVLYKQMIPLDIISKMMAFYHIQGEKQDFQFSLSNYLGSSLQYIRRFKKFICSGKLSRLKQQIMYMPIVKRVFEAISNQYFLDQFSNESLGDTLGCLIGNVMKLYLKNVKLLVLADMLFMGYFSIVNEKYLPSIENITEMLDKARRDEIHLKNMFDKTEDISILNRLIHVFEIAVKRVSRFQKRVYNMHAQDESHSIINLIFGDVYDHDGEPTVCCVCLDNSCEKKDTWMQCPNGHKFHYDCYNKTIRSPYKNCPLCRVELVA